MISLRNIRWQRGGFTLQVDSLQLNRGEVVGIVGPNGSGKSSLLQVLGLLDSRSSGEFFFEDFEVPIESSGSNLELRRRISYLMQNPYLFSMSVYDNIAYGLKIRGVALSDIDLRVCHVMTQMSLSEYRNEKVTRLSGGEKQRVALARNLVLDADLYLLDEPTANVDTRNVHEVELLIRSAAQAKNAAVVITTHSREQAYRLSDRLISMVAGRIHDLPYENVFSGQIEKDGHIPVLILSEAVKLRLGQSISGQATVAVDPGDILISLKPFQSSALNHFKGVIRRVEAYNGSMQVFVDTGIDFCSLITQQSYSDLGLNVGKEVWVTFKANAVKVIG